MAGNKYLNEQGLGHLWERIKIYTSSTYLSLTGGNVTGPVSFGDSVSIDDLNAGTLVVTGNSSFTNNAQFNTINGVTVGPNPKFTDTWNKVSTTQDGYVTKLPGGTTSFLRGDGSWATPPDTTYVFDGTYNSSTNKVATVNTVTNAINNLDGGTITGTPGAGKTITALSQSNGLVSATFNDISIKKSQISDFPTSMPASDVPAWAKEAVKPSYHLDEVQPLLTKTYTGIIADANDAAHAWFFFGSIRPTSWQAIWSIRYRIKGDVPNQVGYDQQAEVTISGSYDVLRTYASYNKVNASLSAYYHELYRLKQAGFNSGYGHLLGVRLQSSTNPTNASYKRTFDIEILELKNCTFTFFDNFKLYNTTDISWSGTTNYTGYSEINYCNNGLQETGDANDVNYYNRENYASRTTSAALYRYQFCLTKSDGTLVPVNTVNNSVATNKTLTMDTFDPFGDIFYWSSTSTYSAGGNVGNSALYRQYLCDLRYSFNCGGYNVASTLIARKPLYLVAVPQDDGTAELYAEPLSMQLPSSVDNLIYIYLGRVYEDTYPYRVVLSPKHPIYEYRDGAVRLYTGLKSKAAASGGTEVSLVTTGEKYLWNSKTNNIGTVTSVAAAAVSNSGITISGSPITSEGTITIGLDLNTAINGLTEGTSDANRDNYAIVQQAGGRDTYHRRKLSNVFAALNSTDITNALGGNKSANFVFAGPDSGNAATPSFRALVEADIPGLAWSKITSGNDDLKAIEALTGTSGLLKKTAANTWTLDTSTYLTGITSSQVTSALGFTPYNATNPNGYTSNTGTVTSVQVKADSPLQSSTNTAQNKTLSTTISFVKQNANVVLAGPSSGSTTASPTFRALVEADIPSLSKSKISDFPTSWDLSNISGADDLKKIEALTGTTGFLKKTNTNTWSLDTNTYLTAATLPTAASDTLGGIKIGYTASGKKYPVQLDSNSKAYVQVPWADNNTTYTAGTGLSLSGNTFNHSNSIAAGTAGTSSATSSTNRQIAIPYVTYDAQGHITASGTHTHTIESFPEAYLTWGGRNFSSSYGPIDAAMIPQLGANRFAFLKPAGIEIEYSTDAGESWDDYEATDSQKVGLFSTSGSFYLGKAATKENNNVNNMLRITITTNLASIYTVLNKIAIYMSTQGNTVWVKIERATQAAPTNYITHLDWTQISGWSGWNILNISGLTTYGNTSSQNQKVRFIFKQTAISANNSSSGIWCVYGFGGVGWTVPSNMAKNGHLYSYDSNQNATFPAQITATQFNGNATKDSDGNVIKDTYLKLSGGTMTGVLTTKANLYTDAYNSGALNLKNSNIDGVNSIYTADTSENAAEGIHFYRDSTHVDSLYAKSGVLYFTPNRALGSAGTDYSIYHSGITTFDGNATSATKLTQVTDITSLNDFIDSTYLTYIAKGGSNTVANKPSGVDAFGALSLKTAQGYQGQLLMSSNKSSGLYWRTGIISSNAISANWLKVLDSNNYTDYTVTKTGTGASGTWGISITGNAANVTGTVTVDHGGTGATSFTSGALLIGNGTEAIGTRAIKDIRSAGNLGWTDKNTDIDIPTINTLAYWNGRYNSSNSNLTYCIKGAFGDAATKGVVTTLDTSANLPTASAVKTYIDTTAQNTYVTLSTTQTITGRKTFNDLAAVTFKPSSSTDKCNINYDASLGALVFSFAN